MTYPDYHARAELFLGSDSTTAIAAGPRSFTSAAKAILFAFEQAAPVSLRGALLQVGTLSYSGDDLIALYRSADFPLPRKSDVKRSNARRPRNSRPSLPLMLLAASAGRRRATA